MRKKLAETQKLISDEKSDGRGKMEMLMQKVKEENERKAALEEQKRQEQLAKERALRARKEAYLKALRAQMEVESDKWTQYATRQGYERPPRPLPSQIWYNRRLTIADYDRVHLQNFQHQHRNKHLDFDPENGQTLRVFSEKPSLIKKHVNLHEEIPEGLYEIKNDRRNEALRAMDIRGMWRKLEREHPDAMSNCQQFSYHESVTRT